MPHGVTVPELLDGHAVLDIECLDRTYLNGYVPLLQVGGQVVRFLHDHRGMPVASPAVFEQIGTRFRQAGARFAERTVIRSGRTRRVNFVKRLFGLIARCLRAAVNRGAVEGRGSGSRWRHPGTGTNLGRSAECRRPTWRRRAHSRPNWYAWERGHPLAKPTHNGDVLRL